MTCRLGDRTAEPARANPSFGGLWRRADEANIVCHFWVGGKLSVGTVKMTVFKPVYRCFIAVAILLCLVGTASVQPRDRIELNDEAFAFARNLIRQAHVIADRKGAWSEHRPSAHDENEFIRLRGFSEYAKWHLGIDDRYPENTKRRYKFPYGDFKNIHRCGVLAVESRANEHRDFEIENAAAKLRTMIETPRVGR